MTAGLDRSAAVAATSAAAAALATDVEGHLGLPEPASRSVERVTDSASGLAVDEVTDLDAGGTPIAISRFDLAGRLVSLVRLGFVAPTGSTISAAGALGRAAAILATLGAGVQGVPAVTPRAAGGWLARWVRLAGTVPVPGDGIGIQLAADGSFRAIVRTEHRLAPAPAVPIGAARARFLAERRLDAWFGPGVRPDAVVTSLALAWVAPNDTFGDAVPAVSPGELRLAWIVRVATSGSLADHVAGIELAFDAGDGSALGGELLE